MGGMEGPAEPEMSLMVASVGPCPEELAATRSAVRTRGASAHCPHPAVERAFWGWPSVPLCLHLHFARTSRQPDPALPTRSGLAVIHLNGEGGIGWPRELRDNGWP